MSGLAVMNTRQATRADMAQFGDCACFRVFRSMEKGVIIMSDWEQ